jgi:phenylpropionate dioxygenase-like ring-hydroxylating dioxygenase large terminal subunit
VNERPEPDLDRLLALFWHPVCTLGELAAAAPRPLAVSLLGRRLAIADVGAVGAPQPIALVDRCAHRSTRLSVGWVEPGDGNGCRGTVRCAYHGWQYAADGRCVDIPALNAGPVPARAKVDAFEARVEYGLVWVRIDGSAATEPPAHPAFTDPLMHCVEGTPYTWPTSAPRRVENFVDLSHFAWVHDGTLGRRDEPVPPVPEVRREDGELRFAYDPPDMAADPEALFGHSRYRMPMPCTVDIEFFLPSGARRRLWMTASPVDARTSRTFWTVARDDDLDGDDGSYLAFQQVVLDEDEPVVCNQDPPEMRLDPSFEVSVRTDKVSIEYRRYLRDLASELLTVPTA